jgi:tetratricopeptide (TPR) repeat protein
VVTIHFKPAGRRWLLLLPALLAILGGWFVARWYVGNTVAEYAPGVDEGGIDIARLATKWAPADPLTHWRLGSLEEKAFSVENMAAAVREYQLAVTLSPNDYRYWMELGRALEASGDRESGEKALRRAVDLAPAYSHPRWHFGNLLLREGKLAEAFEQLGHAAEADNQMRPQVFDLAMRVFEGDVNEIARVASVSPAARMQFAVYLASVNRFDDAMRMWATISPADRRAQSELSVELKKSLFEAKQFRYAVEVMRETDPDASLPHPEQFANGGFESSPAPVGTNSFDWVINSRPQAQISIDSRAHSGHSSLRIVFRANNLDKIQVSQVIVVEPGAQYRFECFVRTEDLSSASTPILVIRDAVDNAMLGEAKPLATGTNEWQQVTFDFKTNPKHDGIIVGFYRAPCGEEQICPIFGTVWYDDFNLQRIGGPGSSPGESGSTKR